MLAKIGNKVRELTRVKLGPLTLHGLGPGQFRELTSREIRELRSMKDREPVARRVERSKPGLTGEGPSTAWKNKASGHASGLPVPGDRRNAQHPRRRASTG